MTRIQNVLVPIDFGPASRAALRDAQLIATRFKSRVHLLHVVAPYLFEAWDTATAAMPPADLLAQIEQNARRRAQRLVPTTGPLARRTTVTTTVGVVVDSILDAITARHIDLVVMGTHGRGIVGQVVLGSVAQRIVQRSPVPVLTVHGSAASARLRAGQPRARRPAATGGRHARDGHHPRRSAHA
jgi:nucleotide-binding universal stress UspA family protein